MCVMISKAKEIQFYLPFVVLSGRLRNIQSISFSILLVARLITFEFFLFLGDHYWSPFDLVALGCTWLFAFVAYCYFSFSSFLVVHTTLATPSFCKKGKVFNRLVH